MRIFVASTYSDLLDYRAAATRAILMGSNIPEDMLHWPSDESEPLEVSLRRLRASNAVVLIIAHRYGAPPSGTDRSITELEFEAALEERIPVLAFCIEPEHPWPPKFVEADPAVRAQLDRFRARVERKVTRQLFTTPESLEVAIAHAVAQLRAKKAQTALPRHALSRLREVMRAESLYYSPDALVKVGTAPDGAPLLLEVKREIPVDDVLQDLAAILRKPSSDPMLTDISSRLHQEARNLAMEDQIHRSVIDSEQTDLYVTETSLVSLAAPSVFQSMLAAQPTSPDRDSHPGTMVSGIEYQATHDAAFASLGGSNRFLCIALSGPKSVWSGGWVTLEGGQELRLWRPFIEEGLERLDDVWFSIEHWDGRKAPTRLLETRSTTEFHNKWVDLLSSLDESELSYLRPRIFISRASVMSFIVDVLAEVSEFHEGGRIHGDLKPSNILVSRNGPALIDDVGIAIGGVSPTVSIGWSPPEQLLREPLTHAADVYPLGQLIRGVLQAEALGKQISYRMPDDTLAQVCDNPTIYLSPISTILPVDGRAEWYRLIERALASEPGDRWPSVQEMAHAIDDVTQRVPISGRVEVSFPWGDRPTLVRIGDGDVQMAWMMSGSRSPMW